MILVDTRRLLAAFRGDDRFLRKSFQDYFYCIAENKMEDTHATHTHTNYRQSIWKNELPNAYGFWVVR